MSRKHDFNLGGEEEESSIDLTPMLDVVFIMLDANILVVVDANNDIFIDRRLIDPRAVRANIERLHAENPQGSVVIQPNPRSANKMLVTIMDASREAGVYSISIADSPE